MNVEEELVQFKEDFLKDYIDPHLDRLLDLRNNIRNAKSFDEAHGLLEKEREYVKIEFNLVPREEKKENTGT